jgi:hypothetical protein
VEVAVGVDPARDLWACFCHGFHCHPFVGSQLQGVERTCRDGGQDRDGASCQAPTRSRFARPVRAKWILGPGRQLNTRTAKRQPVPQSQTGPEHPLGHPDTT